MQQEGVWDLFEEQLSILQQIQAQKQAQINSLLESSRKEQLRSEAKTNHMQCQSNLPSRLKSSKRELILKLLEHLQCFQTKNAFQQQIKSSEGGKNPEEQSAIKRESKIKKGKSNQKIIEQMIRVSSSYEQLLGTLSQFYCQSDENEEKRAAQWKSILLEKELEKLIRSLSPQKRQATIPMYHNAEIKQDGKEIILIDINSSEDIVLLDSEFYVHVIPAEGGDVKPFKFEKKKQIILLKWINQSSFLITNNRGRIAAFFWHERQLTLRHQFHLQLPKIKIININYDIEHGSRKIYIKILTVDHSSQFTASLLSIGTHEMKLEQSIAFSLKNDYEDFILLTNKQYGEETLKYDHYFGLTTEQPSSIIKLDSFSKREGVLWHPKSDGEVIKQIISSKCKQYLYAFVCKRKKELFSEIGYSFEDYEFIRMNEKGSCLQRIPLLLGDLMIYNCRLSLTNLTLLDPQWLCCLISDKNICYFSLVTGKLLFSHDIGKGTLSSIKSGASNSIIYQTKNSYGLISTEQRQIKRINLSKRKLLRDRESLILQLTMRNGIPETLLQLLQQLRNNQYER